MTRAGIAPKERSVDEPPGPDNPGRVVDVEHDVVETNRGHCTHKQCQQCREPVDLEAPHSKAWVTVEIGVGIVHKSPRFCGRACWGEWASASNR